MHVNNHLHTPYSFSAFSSVAQALDLCAAQGVAVAGVNDFYTQEAYPSWREAALARKIYPLFNLELITLDAELQAQGLRVNDPANPGRVYLSGKGLRCPAYVEAPWDRRLAQVALANHLQVVAMCRKLNAYLVECGLPLSLDPEALLQDYGISYLRERHLAQALRRRMADYAEGHPARLAEAYWRLGKGSALVPEACLTNPAALENALRSALLKAGKAAFVPEDPAHFLSLQEGCALIRAAGGLPTYPFLADNAAGDFTAFEAGLPAAIETLHRLHIPSVEFIPGRNSATVLETYVRELEAAGFVVTLGSEHNSPAMEPLRLCTRDGDPLSPYLQAVNARGACILAAHQDRVARGLDGYTCPAQREAFCTEGAALIRAVTGQEPLV